MKNPITILDHTSEVESWVEMSIQPKIEVDGGIETPVNGEIPEFWGVYGGHPDGRDMWIADFPSEKEAELFVALVSKVIKQQHRVQYFLFGSIPVNQYVDEGLTKVKSLDDGQLFVYDPSTMTANELLDAYDGYGALSELTKNEYEYLKNKFES